MYHMIGGRCVRLAVGKSYVLDQIVLLTALPIKLLLKLTLCFHSTDWFPYNPTANSENQCCSSIFYPG